MEYNLKLSSDDAERLDIAMSIAVANARHNPEAFKALRKRIQEQFEEQDG